jgi:menaquinone-dependent protoporphyrinogen oxidase
MTQRTLVTYASKAGSTAEVAARIGETLAKRGSAVDVLPIGKVSDLTPYGTVVVGSAIRMGRVLPEVKSFIEKNQAALQKKSFSTFVVCLTLKDDTAENRTAVAAYLDPVRALVKPASEGLFAGVMNPNKIGLLDRLIMMAMKSPEGDYRKWDQITAWAEGVAA